MGRQAYLTRLALGRSPFQEPELTESGEFILGSHAHDLDNQAGGYVQQFDDNGHPEHRVAKVAEKEFRRAKNCVLETIGVVAKKEKLECKRRKTTEMDKVAALRRENSYGPWLKAVDSGLTLLSLWWLMSLRRRFQTFESFSSLPLLEIIKSEIRTLGSLTFFSSGVLGRAATLPLTLCRQGLVEIAVDSVLRKLTNGAENAVSRRRYATRAHFLCRIVDFSLFAIVAPVLMFSDLQMLHLIPSLATLSLSSLIPFMRNSPIRTLRLSRPLTIIGVLRAAIDILRSPIVILWLYDRGQHALEALTYHVVRTVVPRPDMPDKLSKLAANKGDEDDFDQETASDELLPQEMVADSTSLEAHLPDNRPRGLPSDVNLAESHNTEPLTHGQTRYIQHDPTFPADNSDAFWQYFLHSYRTNVTTSDGHLHMWENPASDATPPPIRRARRLTDEVSSSRSFSRSQSRAPHPLDTRDWTQEPPRHHVTSLSNYPADAFAYHMSSMLTTVIMLPLESLYLRALVRGFLESPMTRPGAIAAAAGIRADVRSLGAWFGGDENGLMGKLQYASTMVLIWGMQCVLSAGIWGAGTRVAIWIGRIGFG